MTDLVIPEVMPVCYNKEQNAWSVWVQQECLTLAEYRVFHDDGRENIICRACLSRWVRYGHSIMKIERL